MRRNVLAHAICVALEDEASQREQDQFNWTAPPPAPEAGAEE